MPRDYIQWDYSTPVSLYSVVKDPRIVFRERIECIRGSNGCIRYRSEAALSASSTILRAGCYPTDKLLCQES